MSDDGPSPRILVANGQAAPVAEAALVELARTCLIGEGVERSELSVAFVTSDEMAELRERYTGEPGATDVLSFPQDEVDADGVRILGDVVIAPDVAAGNNPGDPAGEVRLLLVHGILHLLGHDHEDEGERRRMWAIQERYSGVRAS
jgi:probable rRNA maturation factor